jgi:serine protease Do
MSDFPRMGGWIAEIDIILPFRKPRRQRRAIRKKAAGERKMDCFLRPYRSFSSLGPVSSFGYSALALSALAACFALGVRPARAQAFDVVQVFEGQEVWLTHSGAQGYLGVHVTDVDPSEVQTYKLKDAHGALITLVDHDAPAGKIGLKVNDVVLELDGQNIGDAEQLGRVLKDIPPGRKVSLQISREGAIQTVAVQLAERTAVEHDVWDQIGSGGDGVPPAGSMGILAGGGNSFPSGFHFPFFGSTLKVGALVEPLTTQMAAYLGVESGLMVKQVERKSEAAAAGLRAFDVILRVGSDAIATSADWERALRSNQGKPVQLTILRDKKQQQLTLKVDSKRQKSQLDPNESSGTSAGHSV